MAGPRRFFVELGTAVVLLTRIPVPASLAASGPDTSNRSLRWAPLVGLIAVCVPGALLVLAAGFAIPPMVTALLAVGASLLVTGALHEDGLADVADGFGGGWNRERKLEIMRDSRVGSYGALAIAFSLLLRAACVAALLESQGSLGAIGGFATAAILARAFMLLPLWLLPPARRDGQAHAVGRLDTGTFLVALVAGVALTILIALVTGITSLRLAVTLAAAAGVGLALTRLARAQIGGVTGDVVGATEQIVEFAVLAVLCTGPAVP